MFIFCLYVLFDLRTLMSTFLQGKDDIASIDSVTVSLLLQWDSETVKLSMPVYWWQNPQLQST